MGPVFVLENVKDEYNDLFRIIAAIDKLIEDNEFSIGIILLYRHSWEAAIALWAGDVLKQRINVVCNYSSLSM